MSDELKITTITKEAETFNVLSLFDGMSCAQIALKELGITPTNYYASEIKKSAIQFTQHNFPKTKQLGDVLNWRSWKLPRIDLVAFGSPCQNFSNLNFTRFTDDGVGLSGSKSALFFVAFDILEHLRQSNPDILFLAENVQGSEVISKFLKVEPIFMNNLEFSCSMRHRLWFTNIAAEKCTDVLGGVFYKRTIRDSTDNKNICLRLDKPSLHEKGLWMPLTSAEKMLSHPLSSGFMFEDGCNMQTGCVIRSRSYNKFGYSLVHQQGQYRYHTEGELRQMHCIPDWVQFPDKSLRVVQDLVGDGWSIKCATHILKHLPCILHESSVQCSSL